MKIGTYVLVLLLFWGANKPSEAAPTSPVLKSPVAKTDDSRPPEPSEIRELDEDNPKLQELDAVSLSLPKGKSESEPTIVEEFRPTRTNRTHTRSIMTGLWRGNLTEKNSTSTADVGLVIQNDNKNETAQVYGVHFLANSGFGFHWDFQQYCCIGKFREPFWGLGVGWWGSADKGLAQIADYEHYAVRAKVGFDDLTQHNRRVKLEFVAGYSLLGLHYGVTLGLGWDAKEVGF